MIKNVKRKSIKSNRKPIKNRSFYNKYKKKINLVFNRTVLYYKLSPDRVFSSLRTKRAKVRQFLVNNTSNNAYANLLKLKQRRLKTKKKYNFTFRSVSFIGMRFFLSSLSIFGLASHLTSFARTWNADYFGFILGRRFKRAVIEPTSQAFIFHRTYSFIKSLMQKNMTCLIYESRLISRMKAEELGIRLGEWIPGMLTNKGIWARLLYKNRVRYFFPLYAILFLSDPKMIHFVREMRILGIPSIGFMYPYISSWAVDYPFLTNLNYRLINYYLVYLRFQFSQVRKNLLFKLSYFRQPTLKVLQ
jgi:hypothetical protein